MFDDSSVSKFSLCGFLCVCACELACVGAAQNAKIALIDITRWENGFLPALSNWNTSQSKQGCNLVMHQGVTPPGCGASNLSVTVNCVCVCVCVCISEREGETVCVSQSVFERWGGWERKRRWKMTRWMKHWEQRREEEEHNEGRLGEGKAEGQKRSYGRSREGNMFISGFTDLLIDWVTDRFIF